MIYGTLALLAFAVPRGLVNWSNHVEFRIGAEAGAVRHLDRAVLVGHGLRVGHQATSANMRSSGTSRSLQAMQCKVAR